MQWTRKMAFGKKDTGDMMRLMGIALLSRVISSGYICMFLQWLVVSDPSASVYMGTQPLDVGLDPNLGSRFSPPFLI